MRIPEEGFMAENSIVSWHSSYSVGIPLIDEQHKELINLTNKLFNSCIQGNESSKIIFMRTIRGTVDYVGYHFSTEEKVMERINYPGLVTHKKEHTDFVKEVLHEVEEFKSGKKFTPISFVHYLKDWVLTHIAVSDKQMGDYILRLKKAGGLDQIKLKVKEVTHTEEDAGDPQRKTTSKRFVIE
jgi:hemerythrin